MPQVQAGEELVKGLPLEALGINGRKETLNHHIRNESCAFCAANITGSHVQLITDNSTTAACVKKKRKKKGKQRACMQLSCLGNLVLVPGIREFHYCSSPTWSGEHRGR